jgi:murein DD-endopeptidase MepM/ murein hydrolase activator NlpD
MGKVLYFAKKAFTPVTIMVIPHENVKSLSIRIPTLGILLSILLCVVGSFQVVSLAARGLDYPNMVERVNYFSRQFGEWNSTLTGLKKMERDFHRLFALGSKERVLENMEISFSGDIDWESLRIEIQKAVAEVNEIKDYLRVQKDIYMATPKGFPVSGRLTSHYGMRESPFGGKAHHAGVDIAAQEGTPIKAAADGIVSFAGWANNSGNVVVVEHGCGFSTIYAHNKNNKVKIGQKVKRGDPIASVGATGNATGPHLHYEVMQNGKTVNPKNFLSRSS